MKTKDSEHLQWIHDRIVEVYGESPNVDFLNRFRLIIEQHKEIETGVQRFEEWKIKKKLVIPKTTKEQRVQLNEGYKKK